MGYPYEEVRDFGGSYTPRVGIAIVTNLAGAFSADRTLSYTYKMAELFAVSGNYRTRRNIRASFAKDHPRVPRE